MTRGGDRESAAGSLNWIYRTWPDKREECAVAGAFFRFFEKYNRDHVLSMFQEFQERFRVPENLEVVEDDIRKALRLRQPYLLLRLGDGEGSYMKLGEIDELEHAELYRSNRMEFLKIWFADMSMADDDDWIAAMDDFNQVISRADCIGSVSENAIENEYYIGSRRGIAWVVNTMRKVMQKPNKRPMVCDLIIHYQLLLNGALHRLIGEAEEVGLISCHEDLPIVLAKRFSRREIEFYKVPGEQAHSEVLGSTACAGRHWPDGFKSILDALAARENRGGQLFLVAAGILGKIYAGRLHEAGAVVIDIGAVADLWMGKITRTFPNLPEELRLV